MAGKSGNYSNIIVYDERRRYYYMWPQRNKPLLDDEIRDMGVGLLDQARRGIQRTWGDVAAPYNPYSAAAVSTAAAFKVAESGITTVRNFTVTGGNAGGDSLDHASALYVKGFYVFLAGDLEYNQQMYPSDTIDLATESDKYKTLTPIPALTTPDAERIDIVYVHLHFEEVSSEVGSDLDVYRDSSMKNPMVGTDTANRLRAVIDIRVREGWTDPIDANIFTHSEFLGAVSPNDSDPTDNDYKVPIAVIYRHAFSTVVLEADIVDLLTTYDKRVKSVDEISWRTEHGGYTQEDVDQLGYTGFSGRFPSAVVDEGAFATGLNQGLDTEAFNSESVTPRVVDQDGKFMVGALMVGHATGLVTYETGPELLHDGEAVVTDLSAGSVYVGYDRGVTGMDSPTGAREYLHNVSVYARGESGTVGVEVVMENGDTGAYAALIRSRETGLPGNYVSIDRLGRVGMNTMEPGWEPPKAAYGLSGSNIVLDVNDSARVRGDFVAEGDVRFDASVGGRTWVVPAELSELNPAVFGYTGSFGITGAVASMLVRRGIAVVGESGISGYGYTGVAGQYECYDLQGRRMFTIGDLGPEFDRVVKTLYGAGLREAYHSDYSFLSLPGGYDYLKSGDTVSYDILKEDGVHVTGAITVTQSAWEGVEEVRDDIIYNTSWGAPTGLYRSFVYTDYRGVTGSLDDPYTVTTGMGEAFGVQIVENIYGFTGAGYTGAVDDSHGSIIIKEMPEDPVAAEIRSIESMTVSRALLADLQIPFTEFHYYGSGGYGGDVTGTRFVKLDLGEGADAWLFNGDVFFNSVGGNLNRVVFSPNVIFRDDVYIYGTLFADQLRFNFARVGQLLVDNNIQIDGSGTIGTTLAVGQDARATLDGMQGSNKNSDPRIKCFVRGGIQGNPLVAESEVSDGNKVGDVYLRNSAARARMYVRLGGTVESTSDPVGIHLHDDRAASTTNNTFVIDYSGGISSTDQVTLDVRGDIKAERGIIVPYVAVGDTTTIDTDYPLYVVGNGYVDGELTVESLRFAGAEAPSGDTDIITPVNVVVVDNDQLNFHNNEVILRDKKFTITERVYLNNNSKLGVPSGVTGAQEYYEAMTSTSPPIAGWFGHDTLTFTEDEFTTLVGSSENDLFIDEITDEDKKRYDFKRVNTCTLGSVKIEWTGYAYDPSPIHINADDVIQSYTFESPYFRNRDGGSVINWMPGSRFGDENFIVHIEGNLIDTHPDFPAIYNVEGNLAVYIPKVNWRGYGPTATNGDYRSFVLWYPYENVTENFNYLNVTQQTLCGGYIPVASWKAAIYPRLVKQTRLPFDTSAGSNLERMYNGEWDLNVAIFPESVGRLANLTGRLYISYVQS